MILLYVMNYGNMYTLCSKAFKLIVISEKKSTKLKCFCLIFLHMLRIMRVWCMVLYSEVNA